MSKSIVIGFLGTKLDRAAGPARWEVWRPSIALCQQDDFRVDRFELLHDPKFLPLAASVAADIRQVSPETEVRLHALAIRDPWDFQDVYEALHDFCRGYPFDPRSEHYFAHMTTGTHVAQICLFLLTEARFLPGKLVQAEPPRGRKAGRDPGTGRVEVIDLDLSKYERIATRFAKDQAEARDVLRSGIATRNRAFNQLIAELEVVALRSTAPILLTGPTGAGKSQLARRLFELRGSRGGLAGNFVEINCATLRGDTATSTLFGHRRGAFTGAAADRPGLLREAHGGLLFLDEIGELGPDEQAMLLRALEEGTFLPVGSDTPVKSQFQLIAGTNRDLRQDAGAGTFREDLLSRINLWTFELPALRDRPEDIAPNLDYELQAFGEREGRAASFNKEARERFLQFAEDPATPWRGNFRDLNAAVTRMATLAPRNRIGTCQVEAEITRLTHSWERPGSSAIHLADDLEALLTTETLRQLDPFDRVQLAFTVATCRASKSLSEAGRTLFSASRQQKSTPNDADRLRKYLARFALRFDAL